MIQQKINGRILLKVSVALPTLFITLFLAIPCYAINPDTDDNFLSSDASNSVLSRQRRLFQSEGFVAGNFNYQPSLSIGGQYNDNIFARENNTEGDFATIISPSLNITHSAEEPLFGLTAGATNATHLENSTEDYLDYRFGGRLTVPLTDTFSMPLGASLQRTHERRGNPESRNPDEVNTFLIYQAGAGLRYSGSHVSIAARTDLQQFRFDNAFDNGVFVRNDDRDRTEYRNSLRFGLAMPASVRPYLEARHANLRYERNFTNLIERDADQWAAVGGIDVFISGVSTLNAELGYVDRTFEDTSIDDINAVIGNLSLTWEPSTLFAATLTGSRDIDETGIDNQAANTNTQVQLDTLYELYHNVMLTTNTSYRLNEFEEAATGDSSAVSSYNLGAGINYLLRPNMQLNLSYNYMLQDTDNSAINNIQNFNRNTIGLFFRIGL